MPRIGSSKRSSNKRASNKGSKNSSSKRKTSRKTKNPSGVKRKHSRRKRSNTRKASNSKTTWKQFLNHEESKKILSKTWTMKDPKKYYEKTIRQLADKYKKSQK